MMLLTLITYMMLFWHLIAIQNKVFRRNSISSDTEAYNMIEVKSKSRRYEHNYNIADR